MYNRQYNKPSKPIAKREKSSYDEYIQQSQAALDYYHTNGITLVRLEKTYFPETGGTRWVATVEVAMDTGELKPSIIALKFVNQLFPGVYNSRDFQLQTRGEPTFEISWFTNKPQA